MRLRQLLDVTAPYPAAALEIGSDAVRAIRLEPSPADGFRLAGYARRVLPPGAVTPSLEEPNIVAPTAVTKAVREAMDEVGYRGRPIALLLPDTVCRVAILDLEAVPASSAELSEVVRLRLKKVLPFPAEEARVAHARLPASRGPMRLLAVAGRETVLRAYEQLLDAAGLSAGLIDVVILGLAHVADRLAAAADVRGGVMVVNVDEGALSVAVLRGGDLLFLRTKALTEGGATAEALAREVRLCQLYYQDRLDGDVLQAVYLRETGGDARLGAEVAAATNAPVKPLHSGSLAAPAAELDAAAPFEAAALVGMLTARLEALPAAAGAGASASGAPPARIEEGAA